MQKQNALLNIAHFSQLPSDGICLAKKRVDPTTADEYFGQLLDGPGKPTSFMFCLEFVPPVLGIEQAIGSSWVSHP